MVRKVWERGKIRTYRKKRGLKNKRTGEFFGYGSKSSLDRKYHERTKFFTRGR